MPLTTPDDPLAARVFAALDARLEAHVDHPVALALSGGGDSIALLHLASAWAQRNGRRLLALTVDHGLNPDSADWTRRAGEAAHAVGADWRALVWTGEKPTSGLPAAARRARHALIADAAREAGARVVLFAHTADDAAEGEWMRARGANLGRLRDGSPSPVWPEGRGLMIGRPLLNERRSPLRDWLLSRGLDWIEDPANADMRHLRVRARRALSAEPAAPAPPARSGASLRADDHGVVRASRDIDGRALAFALVCAGGGERPPRGARLGRVLARLHSGESFTATLAGARIEARGESVLILREPGEARRGGLATQRLPSGRPVVWDGRFEIEADVAGWTVAPAKGRMAGLSSADRAVLARLPAAARATAPVLIRDGAPCPVLAGDGIRVRPLVDQRLASALDQTPHEAHLDQVVDGGTPSKRLFADDTSMTGPFPGRTTRTE